MTMNCTQPGLSGNPFLHRESPAKRLGAEDGYSNHKFSLYK